MTRSDPDHPGTYWIETLGCPKNAVDSEKLAGVITRDGFAPAASLEDADLIVVNTCAFIEDARRESVETVLDAYERRRSDATQLVVTGCMAERYGTELRDALPEADLVVGFGASPVPVRVPVSVRPERNAFDLLNLPRPRTTTSWAYLKVAEGCDRACGFCAIPQFRGPQRSRTSDAILEEARSLAEGGVRELVLVAQDPARFGLDRGRDATAAIEVDDRGATPLQRLLGQLAGTVDWLRVLYLYPSGLTDGYIERILATGVPYFDLSLQHASRPLLARMRRWGDGDRFLERIRRIRSLAPEAAFRSSFILGYPGETEEDQRRLVRFLEEAQLDWAGFFLYSKEAGTLAEGQDGQIPSSVAAERLAECSDVQDAITRARRERLAGQGVRVLVDRPGVARSFREAPEIDGVIEVPRDLRPGEFYDGLVVDVLGADLRVAVR